jgi:hypothetical protein
MRFAKSSVEIQERNHETTVKFLSFFYPTVQNFRYILLCLPYVAAIYVQREQVKKLMFFGFCLLSGIYIWFLRVRYLDHGLWDCIFHWNTISNGIYIILVCFILDWLNTKLQPDTPLPENASEPSSASQLGARGRSPGRSSPLQREPMQKRREDNMHPRHNQHPRAIDEAVRRKGGGGSPRKLEMG